MKLNNLLKKKLYFATLILALFSISISALSSNQKLDCSSYIKNNENKIFNLYPLIGNNTAPLAIGKNVIIKVLKSPNGTRYARISGVIGASKRKLSRLLEIKEINGRCFLISDLGNIHLKDDKTLNLNGKSFYLKKIN